MYSFHKIRALWQQGKNKTEIARELKIHRQTVRKYILLNKPPSYRDRNGSTKKDHFLEFKPLVVHLLERTPNLNSTEIFELIREKGFSGSYRTVHRRLKGIREKASERFFEQEYEPGEQAQFDFKEKVRLQFIDGEKIINLHFGTLPFSDTCFIKGYPHKNFECFMDGIHSFFEHVGGLTKNIRIDNLSPCVKELGRGTKRVWTENFDRAIQYYGFGVLACSPGKGNEKGDVERDIRTFARRFCNFARVHNIVFEGFDHLNRVLLEFLQKQRPPSEKLAEESGHFQTLPERDENILCHVEETRASSFGTVRLAKANYSVPDSAINKLCRVVSGCYAVQIYTIEGKKELIAVHPKIADGNQSILLEHVLKSLLRKPQAMIRWRHKEILFPDPLFKQFYNRLKAHTTMVSNAERDFLKSLNLVQYVPLSEIKCGMELILETDTERPFDELKDLLLSERRPAEISVLNEQFKQTPIQANLKQYDQFIPEQPSCLYTDDSFCILQKPFGKESSSAS